MRLVARDGKIIKTNLNKEQYSKFEEAVHWYEKASRKIVKRFARGVSKGKESLYSKTIALAIDESSNIDVFYKKLLEGEGTVEEFKDVVGVWFYKVKEGFDKDDKDFKKTKELF